MLLSYPDFSKLSSAAEAHGGSCYCATAALMLMDRLGDLTSDELFYLKHYCLQRCV